MQSKNPNEDQHIFMEGKKSFSRLIVRPASNIIDDDPNSLDSVISNLPLTVVPSLARISTFESQFSR